MLHNDQRQKYIWQLEPKSNSGESVKGINGFVIIATTLQAARELIHNRRFRKCGKECTVTDKDFNGTNCFWHNPQTHTASCISIALHEQQPRIVMQDFQPTT